MFNFSKTLIAAVTILTSVPATVVLALPQITPKLDINPAKLTPIILTSISGTITNGGSNNGGQPGFSCGEIEVYAASVVSAPPPPPGGISLPDYKKIGQSVKAQGNIQSGCKYTLPVSAAATGKPIYLFAVSPRKWTTPVNTVDISPLGWQNPVQVSRGQQIENKNMKIYATLIK